MRKVLEELLKRFTFFSVNIDAAEYLENFLISAVSAVVGIRFFLFITGYPQLGSGQYHIAHMLWGGLLMLVAMVVVVTFLNKEAKQLSSIVGGFGFGFFIDELGKFITSDNDYFFQPTIAFLYIFFVLFFLGFRLLFQKIRITKKDYTINALELMKEVVFFDLDLREKKRVLSFLKKADRKSPLVRGLEKILLQVEPEPVTGVQIMAKVKHFLYEKYLKIIRRKRFAKVIASVFVVSSLLNIFLALVRANFGDLSFWSLGAVVSTVTTGLLSAIGVYYLFKRKRILAYERFKQGLLISIFLGHFFAFYREQLGASLSLLVTVSIYAALQYLIEEERLLTGGKIET